MTGLKFDDLVSVTGSTPRQIRYLIAEGFVPPADLSISLSHLQTGRLCQLAAHTEHGKKSLEAWIKN